jgi:hypothetical protein
MSARVARFTAPPRLVPATPDGTPLQVGWVVTGDVIRPLAAGVLLQLLAFSVGMALPPAAALAPLGFAIQARGVATAWHARLRTDAPELGFVDLLVYTALLLSPWWAVHAAVGTLAGLGMAATWPVAEGSWLTAAWLLSCGWLWLAFPLVLPVTGLAALDVAVRGTSPVRALMGALGTAMRNPTLTALSVVLHATSVFAMGMLTPLIVPLTLSVQVALLVIHLRRDAV